MAFFDNYSETKSHLREKYDGLNEMKSPYPSDYKDLILNETKTDDVQFEVQRLYGKKQRET